MTKIAVCIPAKGGISGWFLANYTNFLLYNTKKHELAVCMSDEFPLDKARNSLVKMALETNPDYLLFIDSDMLMPADALDRLISLDKDIVSALYFPV